MSSSDTAVADPMSVPRLLDGRVAVVTGASSGIGEAIARQLSMEGAKIAMAARRINKLQVLQEQCEKMGGVAIAVKCDVTNREDVKELIRVAEFSLGPIDILVNNAGVMYYTMMSNLHEEEWDRMIDINCKGVLNCVGAVLPSMLERDKGHILNISSDAGRKGFPGLSVYSGTKFFVEGFSQGLRGELVGTGVRLTNIQPGDVKTELVAHSTDTEARSKYDGSCSGHEILMPNDVAAAAIYALTTPPHVGVHEILIQPKDAP